MCEMYIGYRMRCAWQCDTGSEVLPVLIVLVFVWRWLVPQYVLQAVQDTVRLQCMRMMRARQNMLHIVYGIVLITLAVYEDDACMRRWLANRWNWRRRSAGRGVDEAIFVRLVTHCLTTHLPQPAAGAKCILYFLVCISFLMQTIPIQNNCLSNCLTPHPSLLNQSSAGKRRGIVLKSTIQDLFTTAKRTLEESIFV